MLTVLWTMLAGVGAGSLGALLGLGGGIFLIPVIDLALGKSFGVARTISLITVIGTSNAVTMAKAGRALVNVRLAMVLSLFSTIGASLGVTALPGLTDRASGQIFGVVALCVAGLMVARLGKRNVIVGDRVDLGPLDSRFVDDDTGVEVSYRVTRLPLAAAVSLVAGVISTLVGVGGGIVVVPVLNALCGVPMRVAAATSALMIGVTSVPGLLGHVREGYLTDPSLAAGAVLGVLAGSRLGFWLSARASVRHLKLLMALLLVTFSVKYLFFGEGQ